ncbi:MULTISPECIES: acetolactate synthase 2 small subunit [unclassified Photobacterium]|uniref:acetolactate synthase 2 small subunit n=1 Tax=unclassified Photobacterium TaxID=2628852 RepID=UPI001B8C4AFD|nr:MULTISPECIES: acetolactate synthase 2 small subunit [unclassified Photobacterium]MDO6707732.1 acetolactate synthase 2 small subunit [Photobacterium sp. 1_MG-2023]QUJ67511.1 acetolactate synthase 2 small subunit [Photobacterium sp. GJ3]
MTQHTLTIQAASRPELLERVLRITRHRGFMVKQFSMAHSEDCTSVDIEVTVDSERPILALYNQLDKLWDVTGVTILEQQQKQQISA